jgi:ribosomal protein S18 acetylase RimI-like enzyme
VEPDEFVCVAEMAGEVVGVGMGGPAAPWPQDEAARAAHPTGECFALYVAPGHQHVGAGRAMLSYLATRLAAKGMRRLVIGMLTVNAPARAFYERIGGRVLGQRAHDDDGVELAETVYVWEGPPVA